MELSTKAEGGRRIHLNQNPAFSHEGIDAIGERLLFYASLFPFIQSNQFANVVFFKELADEFLAHGAAGAGDEDSLMIEESHVGWFIHRLRRLPQIGFLAADSRRHTLTVYSPQRRRGR